MGRRGSTPVVAAGPAPVAPDPVAPDPVVPDPVAPDPLVLDPLVLDPVVPDPVAPDPVAPGPTQISLAALAAHLDARLLPPTPTSDRAPGRAAGLPPHRLMILGVADLHDAGPGQLAAAFEPRFYAAAGTTGATAVLLGPSPAGGAPVALPPGVWRLVAAEPRLAWGRALRLLHGAVRPLPPPVGCDPRAAVDATAAVDPSARVGPFVSIGPGARVGAEAALFAGVYVGADVTLGAGTWLLPGARVLDGTVLGAGVTVGANAVLGSPGFGFDAEGRMPHLGRVRVGDGVWIGAGTCVDRATLGETVVEAGARLDNLVQVGHNARVGRGAVLCGQVGLAGGAVVEAGAVLGGQAGVAGRRTVGAGARVAAQSGVTADLPAGGEYSGHPAEPNRPRLRRLAVLRRLAERARPASARTIPEAPT